MKITKEDIKKYLPHREPFLFVDEVVNIDEENGIHAKNLSQKMNIFFKDTFQIIQSFLV